MIETNNPIVDYLLNDTIPKSGSDYTSKLSELGNGDMQQGLINFRKIVDDCSSATNYADGQRNAYTTCGLGLLAISTLALAALAVSRVKKTQAPSLDEEPPVEPAPLEVPHDPEDEV